MADEFQSLDGSADEGEWLAVEAIKRITDDDNTTLKRDVDARTLALVSIAVSLHAIVDELASLRRRMP